MATARTQASDVFSAIENDISCSICTEIFSRPRALHCLHVYCESCLEDLIRSTATDSMFRCPLCNKQAMVPPNGAQGFTWSFYHSNLIDVYGKLQQMDRMPSLMCTSCNKREEQISATGVCADCVEAYCEQCAEVHTKLAKHVINECSDVTPQQLLVLLQQDKSPKCDLHDLNFISFCESCSKLICEVCQSVPPHKNHNLCSIESALGVRKKALAAMRGKFKDQLELHEVFIKDAEQAVIDVHKQTELGMKQIKEQKDKFVQAVLEHAKRLEDDLIDKSAKACVELQEIFKKFELERVHVQQSIQDLDNCMDHGSTEDIIRRSTEETYEETLRELGSDHSVPQFRVSVSCPPVSGMSSDLIAVVDFEVVNETQPTESPDIGPSSPALPPSPASKVLASQLNTVSLDFSPGGLATLSSGDVVVCEYRGSRAFIYNSDGKCMVRLRTPPDMKGFDVECTPDSIYLTDRSTDSLLVFNPSGAQVKSVKGIGVRGISGICVVENVVYVTGMGCNQIYRLNMSKTGRGPHTVQTDVKLQRPTFVSVDNKCLTVCSNGDHCIHKIDLETGAKVATLGTPRKPGNSAHLLNCPWGLVSDSLGRLMVADCYNHRVCVFAWNGCHLGDINLENDGFKFPHSLAINIDGHLIIACNEPKCFVKYVYKVSAEENT